MREFNIGDMVRVTAPTDEKQPKGFGIVTDLDDAPDYIGIDWGVDIDGHELGGYLPEDRCTHGWYHRDWTVVPATMENV